MPLLSDPFPTNKSAPTEAPTLPDIQLVEDTEAALDPPSRVLIHNDDLTPMDFVVNVLLNIFELPGEQAISVMYTAHFNGVALVGVYPLEDAKYKVGQAHALARAEGYPLTLSIEPEATG